MNHRRANAFVPIFIFMIGLVGGTLLLWYVVNPATETNAPAAGAEQALFCGDHPNGDG